MPEKKTLNEDLFYKGSSANLPRLHTCENKVPFWDFKEFAVTLTTVSERPYTLSEETTQHKHAPMLQPFLANNNKNSGYQHEVNKGMDSYQ